jgi:hypothetical protein
MSFGAPPGVSMTSVIWTHVLIDSVDPVVVFDPSHVKRAKPEPDVSIPICTYCPEVVDP